MWSLLVRACNQGNIPELPYKKAKLMHFIAFRELAESLCYQLGSSPSLPDDLQTLVVQSLPPRVPLSSIPQAQDDTVVCSPDSRAVMSV